MIGSCGLELHHSVMMHLLSTRFLSTGGPEPHNSWLDLVIRFLLRTAFFVTMNITIVIPPQGIT